MISRREVVTAGMLGTLSNAAMAAPEATESQNDAGRPRELRRLDGVPLLPARSVPVGGLQNPTVLRIDALHPVFK